MADAASPETADTDDAAAAAAHVVPLALATATPLLAAHSGDAPLVAAVCWLLAALPPSGDASALRTRALGLALRQHSSELAVREHAALALAHGSADVRRALADEIRRVARAFPSPVTQKLEALLATDQAKVI